MDLIKPHRGFRLFNLIRPPLRTVWIQSVVQTVCLNVGHLTHLLVLFLLFAIFIRTRFTIQ